MNTLQKIVAAGVVVVVAVLGLLAYSVFRAPAQATRPIEAIPLAASTTTSSAASSSPSAAPSASPSAAPATETAAVPATETAAPAASATTGQSQQILAQIVPEESEVRFIIDEVLNNAPKTVVGTTNQVAGEIAVDPSDPTKSRIGTIQVNARTFVTDSQFRNRAIQNRILNTGQYEFITFTPKQLLNLPAQGGIGQSYSFQVVGDLTIRDVTREVTFDVTATPVSETRLEGNAKSTIRYADYGLIIPQVPQVASVDEEVRLEIDFVAVPK
jgi:polyisoprenoid-binding protein YceI